MRATTSASIFERFGTDRGQALARYNPDTLPQYCAQRERCYFGNAPTLAQLNEAYGANTATAFLIGQLQAINEVSGASRKLSQEQISFAAVALASRMVEIPGFKITEALLFFWDFRLQKYGRFYGQVDPDIILQGFNEFARERRRIYNAKVMEENKPPEDLERQKAIAEDRQRQSRENWERRLREGRAEKEKAQITPTTASND